MLSGFYIEEQLEFHGDNFNRITLTSEDEEVLLSREYALAANTGDVNQFINARNSSLFSLGTQIRMDNTGAPSGSNIQNHNSGVSLKENSSFTILSSNITGKSCGLSNFMSYGVLLTTNSSLVVDFQGFVNGSGTGGDFSFGSGGAAAWATNIVSFFGSNVILSGAQCKDVVHSNIRVSSGSQAYIQQSNCTGAGDTSLYVGAGARASGWLTDFRKDGATNSSSDIFIERGGIAQISGANGGSNLTANTVTSDGLFIN